MRLGIGDCDCNCSKVRSGQDPRIPVVETQKPMQCFVGKPVKVFFFFFSFFSSSTEQTKVRERQLCM